LVVDADSDGVLARPVVFYGAEVKQSLRHQVCERALHRPRIDLGELCEVDLVDVDALREVLGVGNMQQTSKDLSGGE
jgi:hypothetical protein